MSARPRPLRTAFFNPVSKARSSTGPASFTLHSFSHLLLSLPPLPNQVSGVWLCSRSLSVPGGSPERSNPEPHEKAPSLTKGHTRGWRAWHRGPGRPQKVQFIAPILQAHWLWISASLFICMIMGKLSLLTSVFLLCKIGGIITLPSVLYCENSIVLIMYAKYQTRSCCCC